jgi:hypothetical protein
LIIFNLALGILIFSIAVLLIGGVYFSIDSSRKHETRRRLDTISRKAASEEVSIIRTRALSYIPWLDKFLASVPRFTKIDDINELPRRKRTGYPSKDSFFIAASGGE